MQKECCRSIFFFSADDDFTTSAKSRWVDRIRLICRQPFRRDVLFGLSTVAVRGISVDDLDSQTGGSPPGTYAHPYGSSRSSLEDSLKKAVGLAGLASAYQNKNLAESPSKGRSSAGQAMSDAEMRAGVENLKSKLSKQTPLASITPKAKYASLFASLEASAKGKTKTSPLNPLEEIKAQKKTPAHNRKRKAETENDNAKVLYRYVKEIEASAKVDFFLHASLIFHRQITVLFCRNNRL